MKHSMMKRTLSLLLVLAMLLGFAIPVQGAAAQREDNLIPLAYEIAHGVQGEPDSNALASDAQDEAQYNPEDMVRVSIVLEGNSTLDQGYSTNGIAGNQEAMAYRQELRKSQAEVTANIEAALCETLDVQWYLTLAANIISANIAYGQLETIANVEGVRKVVLETRYEPCVVKDDQLADPNTATSGKMVGTSAAYALGYTGAGSRVAIIDTGLSLNHESFSPAGFGYSLAYLAGAAEMDIEEYKQSINLLDAEEIDSALPQLNIYSRLTDVTGEELYQNAKVPFGFNYVDKTADYLDHSQDQQSAHGTHVAGIAAANSFVQAEDGSYVRALSTTRVQGIAPDAQILVMKVFGINGGAYDSDYMAAIEDAIILGCDSVNLSLGTVSPGFIVNNTYTELLEEMTHRDTVVVTSVGNSGHWADGVQTAAPGYLYADDVSTHTGGAPGSFTNSFSVGSVDNGGTVGGYFTIAGDDIVFHEPDYTMDAMFTLAGQQEYIMIDGIGTEEDFAAIADVLAGKVAFCSRGTTSFFQKATAAVNHGAIATVIYNNVSGIINMDMTGYTAKAPCVSITRDQAGRVRAASTPVTDEAGNILYYTGTMTISDSAEAISYGDAYNTLSSFSSWGVPGDLSLKPEIIAPGGLIYSADGARADGKSYTTMSGTSMAAPQVTGMVALVGQYLRENGLTEKTGLTARALAISLLMSTAEPMLADAGVYYPILRQGAGLANVGRAITAQSYVLMGENATKSYADGKVKAELGHDPERKGEYTFSFSLNNLTGQEQKYQLSADLFTQGILEIGGQQFMDTTTVPLNALVTWTVNGAQLSPCGDVSGYDFNGDTLVNTGDVQAIMDDAMGIRAVQTNADMADLNADGNITTRDAYLLLKLLSTGLVSLPADGKAEIAVTVTLTEEAKAELESRFENGTYIQGFFYAKGLSTAEGVAGTAHAIPMLAFYGNWTDASMVDRSSYLERLYGNQEQTYIAGTYQNSLIIKYRGSNDAYYYTVNPYGVEQTYPAGREAINGNTSIYQERVTLIRNAAVAAMVVRNQNGDFLYTGTPSSQWTSAHLNVNSGFWQNTGAVVTADVTPVEIGAKEGDVLTVSFVAIPELYAPNGKMTKEELRNLIDSGALGEGAFLNTTITVDSTDPEVLNVYKDLNTGNLLVEVKDNRYIANVQLQSKGGKFFAAAIPQQTEPGETSVVMLDLSQCKDDIGPECQLIVGDYAKNETVCTVAYGGEAESYIGKFYAYTKTNGRGSAEQRWMEIDKDNLWFYNARTYSGTDNVCNSVPDVLAADYVGGYVYMAAADGKFYLCKQGEWFDCQVIGHFDQHTATIRDMAFNYADGYLYAMDDNNTLWRIDPITCQMTKIAAISILNAANPGEQFKKLTMLAIDDAGNFYTVNSGSGITAYLFRFTLDQVVDGQIAKLKPMYEKTYGDINFQSIGGSLAWDHDADVLYMAGTNNPSANSTYSYLVQFDLTTGIASKATLNAGGYKVSYASRLYNPVQGLYIVPSSTVKLPQSSEESCALELNKSQVRGLVGMEFPIEAAIYPWNLTDKTILWTTADPNVATVDADGYVKLVGLGTTTITATTAAAPNLTATCTVTVEEMPRITFSALTYPANGGAVWAEFDTDNLQQWTEAGAAEHNYISGALVGETIYAHDGNQIYTVNPETFEATALHTLAPAYLWSDAAAAPYLDTSEELMEGLMIICGGGTNLAALNPITSRVRGLGTATGSDKLAGIAYVKTERVSMSGFELVPAHFYYVITETGKLHEVVVMVTPYGQLSTVWTYLGDTGLDLREVSNPETQQYASLLYDEASGYLILSHHNEGEENQIYAISPEEQIAVKLGDIGDKVWPAVSLYQHQRTTSLAVKLDSAATVYVGDNYQLNAAVRPAQYTKGVVWSSDAKDIVSVDENGLLTAHKAGTAVITATTVDVDENGQPATATCTVTVKETRKLPLELKAQIVTKEGAQYVSLDAERGSYRKLAESKVELTGAGYHDGQIYGTRAVDSYAAEFYRIDPDNGFAENLGSMCWGGAIMDLTGAPAKRVVVDNGTEQGFATTAFGYPFYLTASGNITIIYDYATGETYGLSLAFPYETVSAMAMAGESTYTDAAGNTYDSRIFYVLGKDGTIYETHIWAIYGSWQRNNVDYAGAMRIAGQVDLPMEDRNNVSMTYVWNEKEQGLVVGCGGTDGVTLWYVDMAGDTMTADKMFTIPDATDIAGLYTEQDKIPTLPGYKVSKEETPMVQAESRTVLLTPASSGEIAGDEKTVTLTLTAKDAQGKDVSANNGILDVRYDAEALTLTQVEVYGEFKAVVEAEGQVKIGFAGLQALDKVATLTFTARETDNTAVTVKTLEVNKDTPNYTETLTLEFLHENRETRGRIEPTCTTTGYTGDIYCVDCGKLLEKGKTVEATGHRYGEWQVTKPATCTEPGEETRYCDACGSRETRSIPATGHSFGQWKVTKEATCTEEGMETRTCACGETETRSIPATGHHYGDWEVTREATCTEKGEETRTCACGETETRATAALGHELTAVVVAPTCTEDGYTEYTCTICGYTYREDVIEASGHEYVAVITEPTCTEAGFTTYTCSVCGDSYVADEKAALGHDWSEWTVTAEATCFVDGEETRTCATCGKVEANVIARNSDNCPSKSFTDLNPDQWYHEAVDYVLMSGLMNGVGEDKFAPNGTLTRAQLVTILYRLEGEPSVEGMTNPFTDVAENQWYTNAIIWAADAGVVNGMTATIFNPNGAITREQIATILYRYAGSEKVEGDYLADFTDGNKVSAYAVDAMNWAVANGLITGMDEVTLAPTATATRAQIAAILMRYCRMN